MSEDCLLFLGDIKGTKAALESFHDGGRDLLERRIEHLHDVFSRCFIQFRDRSRSLRAITFSDSVIGIWTDATEGIRFVPEFAVKMWGSLDKSLISFRGFFDRGLAVPETSVLATSLSSTHGRFLNLLPTGIAAWSVALAESAHFPNGIYVGSQVALALKADVCGSEAFTAGPFEYRRICSCQ
jgi:hypothetical protein